MSGQSASPLIVVRRVKRQKHSHHGGAWKVAYADFVTAMMAFFLVMWLIGVGTPEQRAAISRYFKNPSMTPGSATIAPPGKMGPGGASDSAIQLGGAMDMSHGAGKDKHGVEVARGNGKLEGKADRKIDSKSDSKSDSPLHDKDAQQQERRKERALMEQLMQQLQAAIEKSQALAPFKDQLLLDITPEGLRIQIVDKLNRPMFDLGSTKLKPYTVAILHELGSFINRVPNRISISGHTDDAPYSSDHAYSNWELSSDRGNAARRALIDGGLLDGKIARVVGLAAAVPFDRADPRDPSNRRISIIVMTRQAEKAALSQEFAGNGTDDGAAMPMTSVPTASVPTRPAAPLLPPVPPAIEPAGQGGAHRQSAYLPVSP